MKNHKHREGTIYPFKLGDKYTQEMKNADGLSPTRYAGYANAIISEA